MTFAFGYLFVVIRSEDPVVIDDRQDNLIQCFSQIPGTFLGDCSMPGDKLTGFIVIWGDTGKFNDLRRFCIVANIS